MSDAAAKGRGFVQHYWSDAYNETNQRLYPILQQCEDIGEQIFEVLGVEKSANRQALLKVLSYEAENPILENGKENG